MSERTIFIIKPDAVLNRHTGSIISRLVQEGFGVIVQKTQILTRQQVTALYKEHVDREGFEENIKFMTSGPSVVLLLEGYDAVRRVRELIGSYDPQKACPGEIRYDFGVPDSRGIINVAHATDSPDKVLHEIAILFPAPFESQ